MESTRAGGIVVNSCQLGKWGTQRGGAGDRDSHCTQLWKRHFIFLHLLQLLWQVRLQSTLWHTVERNLCLSGSRWWSAASTWSWSGSFVLRRIGGLKKCLFCFLCFGSVIWRWLSCKTCQWQILNASKLKVCVFIAAGNYHLHTCLRKCAVCKRLQSLCFCDVPGG